MCVKRLVRRVVSDRSIYTLFPQKGLLALLCGNVFIVGINQIYDVEIDKVTRKAFV